MDTECAQPAGLRIDEVGIYRRGKPLDGKCDRPLWSREDLSRCEDFLIWIKGFEDALGVVKDNVKMSGYVHVVELCIRASLSSSNVLRAKVASKFTIAGV